MYCFVSAVIGSVTIWKPWVWTGRWKKLPHDRKLRISRTVYYLWPFTTLYHTHKATTTKNIVGKTEYCSRDKLHFPSLWEDRNRLTYTSNKTKNKDGNVHYLRKTISEPQTGIEPATFWWPVRRFNHEYGLSMKLDDRSSISRYIRALTFLKT